MSRVNEARAVRTRRARAWLAVALGALGALLCLPSCGQPETPQTGSETHFLMACGACEAGSTCWCGVCTRSCATDAECQDLAASVACVPLAPRVATQTCGTDQAPAVCDVSCLQDSDCAALSPAFRCESGFCRIPGSNSAPEPALCVPPQRAASDLIVLGDSLIELSSFTASLQTAAQAAGALAATESYHSYASHLDSFIAAGQLSIANQYATARANGIPRVIVMDGGATDMLNDPCASAPSPSCPAVTAAVQGAEQLLSQFATDGVEDVVYFFYPDYSNPPGQAALPAGLDVLRPLVQSACGRAGVACHWLDLRPLFSGHPDYLAADGIVLSDPGARISANAVWSLIEQRCIAE